MNIPFRPNAVDRQDFCLAIGISCYQQGNTKDVAGVVFSKSLYNFGSIFYFEQT